VATCGYIFSGGINSVVFYNIPYLKKKPYHFVDASATYDMSAQLEELLFPLVF
jgi:hypothetical protein